MNKNRIYGSNLIDVKGNGAPNKLPYQKPELVEIDLSGKSEGKVTTYPAETSIYSILVAPS